MKTKNNCKDFSEDLLLFAYSEPLPLSRKEKLEKHLEKCPACQKELKNYAQLQKDVVNADITRLLSEDFWNTGAEEIKHKIKTQKTKKLFGLDFPGIWSAKFLGSLAMICLFLAAVFIGTHGYRPFSKNTSQNTRISGAVEKGSVDDQEIVAQMDMLENLDVLENILTIVEQKQGIQG